MTKARRAVKNRLPAATGPVPTGVEKPLDGPGRGHIIAMTHPFPIGGMGVKTGRRATGI